MNTFYAAGLVTGHRYAAPLVFSDDRMRSSLQEALAK